MAENIGKIVQIVGPVVDVSFEQEGSTLPSINDALEVTRPDGQVVVLECQQHIGENTVRTIAMDSTDGMSRGMNVVAKDGIWVQTPTTTFYELYQHFSNIFPKFPQEYSFQITYQRCLQLTQSLSNAFDFNTYSSFKDLCYSPLSSILNQIDSNYSIKASVSVNPTAWPAPLTVTFDARTSKDPSNETIPENNYFRYYRDTEWIDQPIWIGSVLSHTFTEAWVYLVHMTVRSSNYDKWYFDWERTFSINVTPKSAIISVYANSTRLSTLDKQKFWTQEWLNWIVFDGSATIPLWWRIIQKHSWTITSTDWFRFYKEWEWTPWIIKVVLPENWEYSVVLNTRDNEWNSVSEKYSVLISDPVAIIKQSPAEWNTSTNFSFDSSTSYSVMSSLRLNTWEIFNEAWDKINTYQWKSIQNKFSKPWKYTVKLTVEDELGQTNTDTIQVNVESSNPVAQFTIKNYDDWKYPSKFLLDASLSSDIDVTNKYDELYYSWSFSDPENTNIEQVDSENKKITVSFNSVWTHTITLTVTDKYWKTNEISKDIKVESVIRPEIKSSSDTAIWWDQIDFIAQSNKDIISYTRNCNPYFHNLSTSTSPKSAKSATSTNHFQTDDWCAIASTRSFVAKSAASRTATTFRPACLKAFSTSVFSTKSMCDSMRFSFHAMTLFTESFCNNS